MLLRPRNLLLSAAALCLWGCPMPPTPAERAGEAARELNLAARWGQVDIAAGLAADRARNEFLERRALWGNDLRILDTELSGIQLSDSSNAVVYVDVSWVRIDETTLRLTRLEQQWKNESGGWRMTQEKRHGGDLGLFGETVEREAAPRAPAQFPTRVIH